MNGYETSTRIHELELDKQPVIIALSASGRGDINLKMKRAGIKAYVPKPFDPLELQEVIIQFLSENNQATPNNFRGEFADQHDESHISRSTVKASPASYDLSSMVRLSKKDPEILKKLIDNSLGSIEKYQEEFEAASNAGSVSALEELIHKNTMTVHMLKAEKLKQYTLDYRDLFLNSETPMEVLYSRKQEVLGEFENIIAVLKNLEIKDL